MTGVAIGGAPITLPLTAAWPSFSSMRFCRPLAPCRNVSSRVRSLRGTDDDLAVLHVDDDLAFDVEPVEIVARQLKPARRVQHHELVVRLADDHLAATLDVLQLREVHPAHGLGGRLAIAD